MFLHFLTEVDKLSIYINVFFPVLVVLYCSKAWMISVVINGVRTESNMLVDLKFLLINT